MPTIYQRLGNYIYHTKKPMLSTEQRVELGKLIASYYTNNKDLFPVPLKRTKSIEPEGKFNVWKYPLIFNDKMDSIISDYYDTHEVIVPKIKRKRIIPKSQKIS